MGIKEYIKKLESLTPEKIRNESLKILKDNEHIAVDFNTKDQLFERGVDSLGRKLQPYTPFTVQKKKEKGHPFDRTTLRDEGGFTDNFFLDTRSFPVAIDSKDFKSEMLAEKYGIDIFGLTASNRKDLSVNYLKPNLVEFLKRNL